MVTVVDRILLEIEARFINPGKLKTINKTLEKMEKKTKRVDKIFQGMSKSLLGFGLSALFTGMAIKRLADTALRSLLTTFMLLADEQNEGLRRTNELRAAFQFLKFVIFDTFARSDLFAGFVGLIIRLTTRIGEFVDKHPDVATMGVAFLGLASALGAVFMFGGQAALSLLGLEAVINVGFIGNVGKLAKAFKALTLSLIPFELAAFAGALPALLLAGGVLVAVGAVFLLSEALGGVKNAGIAMAVTMLRFFAFIGDVIFNAMILPLRAVIALINLIIKGGQAIGKFKGVQTIDPPEFQPLGSRVDQLRDELLVKFEADKKAQGGGTPGVDKTNELLRLLIDAVADRNLTSSTEF